MIYEPKTKPFDHQARLFKETGDLQAHAVLWEQGTGKTKPTIDIFASKFEDDVIDGVIVVAPNGVHLNWMNDELPTHLPDRIAKKTKVVDFKSNKASTKWHQKQLDDHLGHDGLAVLLISYNGFMTKAGKNAVWKFLKRRRCFYILDEAHNIKTPNAKRTKSILASAKYADWRRILTGTPGDKPFDLYSQLRFIEPDIWADKGMANFYAFKNYFGKWFTRQDAKELYNYDPGFDKLIEYRHLDQIAEILASVSDRVLKDDVLDLPDKLYTKLYFEMTPKQTQMYETLRETLELELQSGMMIDGSMAIVRLLRLQQIACGYAVADIDEPVEMCDAKNPRLDRTLEFLEGANHQVIIWARFKQDIAQLMDALGDKAVRYDGQISDEACERNKQAFNAGEAQYFVANSGKGSEGLTLIGAKSTVFYSNSFKFLQRLQAEDRNHRIGQDGAAHDGFGHGVLYGDLCAQGTVDDHVIENLRSKFDIASQMTGDKLKAWI